VTDPKDWKGASLTHQIHQVDMSQSVYFALSNRLAPMQLKSKGTSRQREKHDFSFSFSVSSLHSANRFASFFLPCLPLLPLRQPFSSLVFRSSSVSKQPRKQALEKKLDS